MALAINVSHLARACADPEWRATWVRQGPPSTGGGHDAQAALGVRFHALADGFARRLARPVGEVEPRTADQLWACLHDALAVRQLDRLVVRGRLGEAAALAKRLRVFCQRLADLRDQMPGIETWSHLLLTTEQALGRVPFETKAGVVLVSGRIDAVRRHPEHHLEVVDYKVSRGRQQKHDMLQLAIYAAMLERARPGLTFCGRLEYYLPDLHVVDVKPDEWRGLQASIVQPVLEEIARGRKPRATAKTAAPKKAAPAKHAEAPTDPTATKIERVYAAFKLGVRVVGRHEAPQVVRYEVEPAEGVAVSALVRRAEDLQVKLGCVHPPLIAAAPGFVAIDVPRAHPTPVLWADVIKSAAYRNHPSSVAFAVGVGVSGGLLMADFADPNMAHALVAGAPGSGKSEFLRNLVACLFERTPPSMLRVWLVDPKLLTFAAVAGSRHLGSAVITTVDGAIACLRTAVEEMERRYQVLAAGGDLKLGDRIARGKTDLPYWVLIFDEFADLVLAGKEGKKEFENLVARLVQKGRAAGVHLVLATQRPDKQVVTGLIKASLPLRLCLRVVNATNSQIVLGQSGGEALLGRGDVLCDLGRGPVRAQSPLVTDGELRDLARPES